MRRRGLSWSDDPSRPAHDAQSHVSNVYSSCLLHLLLNNKARPHLRLHLSKHVKSGAPRWGLEAERVHMLSTIIHDKPAQQRQLSSCHICQCNHRSGSVDSGTGISSGCGLAAGVIQGASSGRRSAACCFARLLIKPLGGDSQT